MKSRLFTSIFLFAMALAMQAQTLLIHGRVMHDDSPLPKANVVEIDANHRIINQTQTDAMGHFTLNVTGGKTSVRVTHHGMRKFTRKIGTRTTWEIVLDSPFFILYIPSPSNFPFLYIPIYSFPLFFHT